MNAVEIEEAVSALAEQPFDPDHFPYAFLEAFGNKPTTIQRLRAGSSNKSDIEGGVLQYNNIHIAIAPVGKVLETLTQLRSSPSTMKQKAKFILATDGKDFQSEDLTSGETVACEYKNFSDHFGFYLPLAGISTVKQIRESSFDIKATGRLNRLYVELLKDNPKWGTKERRHDMNHFMARLIFCFFAEDTEIFPIAGLFSGTIEKMSAKDSSNTHEVISEIFRAMNTKSDDRAKVKLPRWVDGFPFVNGGLFSGSTEVPRFSKIARSYLLHIGNLDWKKINPDIFGSMIQAVAEDEERGALGMHYTSVPNILRVLNPLFLDDLRSQLEKAGDNSRMLLNLRKRISMIRVFDPACGSGNFLVIAYKQMREIEATINKRRGDPDARTEILLTNFRGIELRDFPAEIARLALIIAEYQSDVLYRGQKEAIIEFLPLAADNWITCGNALRVDWLSVCPPLPSGEEGEIYICGNPPYLGSRWRDQEQQEDLALLFSSRSPSFKDLDYVAGWYLKSADFIHHAKAGRCAFVATKSICQGEQVAMLWPLVFEQGMDIFFAYRPFHWSNLASHNAGVTVVIVGIAPAHSNEKVIYEENEKRAVKNIGPYLIPTDNIIVKKVPKPINGLPRMDYGNKPTDGGNLILDRVAKDELLKGHPRARKFVKEYVGSTEFIDGVPRYCLWVTDKDVKEARSISDLNNRFENVRELRSKSQGQQANANAKTPHKFVFAPHRDGVALIVPRVSSERRPYLPAGLVDDSVVVSDRAAVIYNPDLWLLSIVVSRMHLVWIATVCVRMRMDFSYSNTLGWNTFPIPLLTEKNRADLTQCAEDILLAREAHFPASIADLYEPDAMPDDLRRAHERNDEVLERIYIGRRFKNDSERLEKLFDLYTKMTANNAKCESKPKRRGKPDKITDKKEAQT